MRTRVLSEPVYEPRGVRYAFAPPQSVPGLGAVQVHICTLAQADFACPGCEADSLTLVYYVASHLRLLQRLWCDCGMGKPSPYEGDASGLRFWRVTALAAVRRLCGHDTTATVLRWMRHAARSSSTTRRALAVCNFTMSAA